MSGPYEDVPVYPSMEKLDYELELGVLIGQGGKNIPVERAMDHVGGYTLFNDMSDRTSLNMGKFIDWYAMKAPDGFAPIGPYILLPEEGLDPHDLRLKLWVNGELRQDATTGDLVWRIAEQVSYLSGHRHVADGRHHRHRLACGQRRLLGEIPGAGRPDRGRNRAYRAAGVSNQECEPRLYAGLVLPAVDSHPFAH